MGVAPGSLGEALGGASAQVSPCGRSGATAGAQVRPGEGHLDWRGEGPGQGGGWGGRKGASGRAQTWLMAAPVPAPPACHPHGGFPKGWLGLGPRLPSPSLTGFFLHQIPPSLRPGARSITAPSTAPARSPPSSPDSARRPHHVCGRPGGRCAGHRAAAAEHRPRWPVYLAWLPGVPGAQGPDPFMARRSCCLFRDGLGPSLPGPVPALLGPGRPLRPWVPAKASPSEAGPSQWLLSPICEGSSWVSTPVSIPLVPGGPTPGQCQRLAGAVNMGRAGRPLPLPHSLPPARVQQG